MTCKQTILKSLDVVTYDLKGVTHKSAVLLIIKLPGSVFATGNSETVW
jgi:hypothetical protein